MLIFELYDTEAFADAVSIMHRFENEANFKSTPSLFSIIVLQRSRRYITALKISPRFFTRFACDRNHYARASIDRLYMSMLDLQRTGRSSLTFSLAEFQHHITLEYQDSRHEQPPWTILLPTCIHLRTDNVGKIDYGSAFCSFDLEAFRRVVLWLDNSIYVNVKLTNSQIVFLMEDDMAFPLTAGAGECLIGGLQEGEEDQYRITLNPIEVFYNFTSKRIWLFKETRCHGIMLIAPMGLDVQISSFYFPEIFVI